MGNPFSTKDPRPLPPPPKNLSIWFLTREWAKGGSPWRDLPTELCTGLRLTRTDTGAHPLQCHFGFNEELEAQIRKHKLITRSMLALDAATQLIFVVPVIANHIERTEDQENLISRFKRLDTNDNNSSSTTATTEAEDKHHNHKIVLARPLLEQCLRFWTEQRIIDFEDPGRSGVLFPEDELVEWMDTTDVNDERVRYLDFAAGYLALAYMIKTTRLPFSICGIHDMGLKKTSEPWPRELLQKELGPGVQPSVLPALWSEELKQEYEILEHTHVYLLYPWPGTWTQAQHDDKENPPTKASRNVWKIPCRNELSYRVDKRQNRLLRNDPRVLARLVIHNNWALRKMSALPSTLVARANVNRALGTLVPKEIKDYVIDQYETHVAGCACAARKKEKSDEPVDESGHFAGCALCKYAMPQSRRRTPQEREKQLAELERRREHVLLLQRLQEAEGGAKS